MSALCPRRKSARLDAILSLSAVVLASPLAAQTPPLSGPVARGVPRQILTARTDAQLTSLLVAGARQYTLYDFELGGRIDHARIRRWTGLLLMPRGSELGKLGAVGVLAPGWGKTTDTWYSHADGTLSKLVLDLAGREMGVMSIRGNSAWVSLDLNRDGIVDFFRRGSLDGHETVAAIAGEGAAFLARWRRGENMLCNPRDKSVGGISGGKEDRTSVSPFGAAGTIPMCGETSENSGPLAGIRRDGPTPAPDPMERLCAGRTTRPRLPGPGPLFDGPGGAGAGGAAGRPAPAAPVGPSELRERAAQFVAERAYIWILKPPKTEKDPVRREEQERAGPLGTGRGSPRPGAEGEADAALNQMCAARARAERRWMVTVEEAERQNTGAGETNCDDPVTDPAALEAEKTMPKCGPNRESESVSERLLRELGAHESRQCSRFEQPGPDGTCRGGRTLSGNRGQVWYGFGNVIGLVPCDGRICDPVER